MKRLFRLLVFLLLISGSLKAQKVYFIYLQTDNQQPFYARMGEKIYNSTPSGYLILSNLRDSSYSVNIGIQGSQSTDQPYSITVNKKDQGFLIKDFGEKGKGLFNLNTMGVIMPSVINTTSSVQTIKTEKREDNAFTNLLAKAADDSTIKEKPVIEKPVEKKPDVSVTTIEKKEEQKNEIKENISPKQEEVKKEIVAEEKKEEPKIDSSGIKAQIEESGKAEQMKLEQLKADSIVAAKNREAELLKQEELRKQDSIEKAKNATSTEVEYKRSVVKLKSESSTTTGIGLVFLDILSNDNTDTIRILIPPDIKKAAPTEVKQDEKKFLDITSADSTKNDQQPVVVKNNNCKVVASDDDFFKLRKKMVGENTDNNMISEASKVFRTKCFSTTQIKNLSTLFLTDEFKYKFFDAAYQYVSDSENFASLQSELKEDYFINRFKAMLRY